MLGEGDQQQEEDRQREPDQQVLQRMDRRPAQDFGKEEAGESQHDEQHAVLHRAFRLQIDIDRVDEIDGQRLAAVRVERVVEIAGKVGDFPAGAETLGANAALARQEAATEVRMRPGRLQRDAVALADRRDGQARGAGQVQRKADGEIMGLAGFDAPECYGQRLQRHDFRIDLAAGETVALAVDRHLRIAGHAARIGQADHQRRLQVEQLGIAARWRRVEAETAGHLAVEMEQPRLVDAALARLDLHAAIDLQRLRRHQPAMLDHPRALGDLAGIRRHPRLAQALAVTQHDNRPDQRLRPGRTLGDVLLHLMLPLAALANLPLDQRQRYQQKDRHRDDGDDLVKQFPVHDWLPG